MKRKSQKLPTPSPAADRQRRRLQQADKLNSSSSSELQGRLVVTDSDDNETSDINDQQQRISTNDDTSATTAKTDDGIDQNDAEGSEANDDDDDEEAADNGEPAPKKGKRKHGIVYLSTVPKHMTVAIARQLFEQHAAVGRMFFQPNDANKDESEAAAARKLKQKKSKRFRPQHFAEGWVEFLSKRAARAVAQRLNGQPIALRKGSKFADTLWTMKYLPRFKWVHLSERLTYEKAVHRQRLQAEVAQARRESQFFQENLDRSDKNKRLARKKAKVTAEAAKVKAK